MEMSAAWHWKDLRVLEYPLSRCVITRRGSGITTPPEGFGRTGTGHVEARSGLYDRRVPERGGGGGGMRRR